MTHAARVPLALAVLALLAVGLTLPLGLNGDIQYVIGGLHAHAAGGFDDTFVHRPLAYRAVVATLIQAAGVLGARPDDMMPFEATVRGIADIGALFVAGAVWRLLRPVLGRRKAAWVAVAFAGTVILAPNFDFLQPETIAAMTTAAGIAFAVWPARPTTGPLIAGLLFATAVALKVATLPLAPLGLLLVMLLDRNRAGRASAWTVVGLAIWGMVSLLPRHEFQWLGDMVAQNPHSLTRAGLDLGHLWGSMTTLGAKLFVSPIVAALPAAIVILVRQRPAAGRWRVAAVLVSVTILAIAPLVLQGSSVLYHLAALPLLAAALAAFAIADRLGGGHGDAWPVSVAVIGVGAVGLPLLIAPRAMLDVIGPWLIAAAALLSLGLGAAAWLAVGRIRVPPAIERAAIAVAIGLAVAPAVVPQAAWSPVAALTPYTNMGWAESARRARANDVQAVAGLDSDATVLYLTNGTRVYHVARQTDCPYPSPLFLQRSAFREDVRSLVSYADTVACIRDSRADVLVLQRRWLRWGQLDPDVRRLVEARFDCPTPVTGGQIEICPRRSAAGIPPTETE